MPREVRVLAVEDKPWWMQPLFSFPFIGDLGVRQLLIVMLFIMPVIVPGVIMGLGFLESLVFLLVMLFVGLGIAKKPVKSVLPEKQLLVFITGKYKPRVRARSAKTVAERRHVAEVPETIEVIARDSSRIPTVKIVGVLRDPLGNPLVNHELEVHVNGRLYTRVRTGSSGEYAVYYTPDGPSLYEVEIRLGGRTILRKRVRVGV
ncbi:MAG: hypothetical protein J7L82_02880 [Staphylothermus sp.]|nr:hypothetical protein [Staphylothermus sp.]